MNRIHLALGAIFFYFQGVHVQGNSLICSFLWLIRLWLSTAPNLSEIDPKYHCRDSSPCPWMQTGHNCMQLSVSSLRQRWEERAVFYLLLMNFRLPTSDDRLLFHALQFCFNRNSVCCSTEWLCVLPVGDTIAFMDQKHIHMHTKIHLEDRIREELCIMHQGRKEFCHEWL